MSQALPIIEARHQEEADEVCAELRAAGIKCGSALMPDRTSATAWLRSLGPGNDRLWVFVHEDDVERAREVLAERFTPPR